ncbi:MAG: cytochrome P450 [Myxococcales bacterium]|nr:cytochrome P450 [Myxococcales bacterium]
MSTAVADPRASNAQPPGPRGKPIVGSLLEAWDDPLALMLGGFASHGSIVRYKFAWIPYVVVADAEAAQHVLVKNARAYHKSPNYDGLKLMLGHGLLTSEGEFWKKQRRLAQPAFHRERLAGFVREMTACTEDLLAEWSRSSERTIDLHRAMMRLTFRIVGKTLLSVDLDGEARAVGEALDVALHWANDYVESIVKIPPSWPTPSNRRFVKAKATLDTLVMRVVVDRRAAMERGETVPNDLLQMLLEAKDADTGETMNDEQLKNELLTLVLAGHETTANALTFTLYLLAKHKDVRDKMRAEAESVLEGRTPTMQDLPKMPYTLQVAEEAMRLYPPAWAFERIALEDDVVGGYAIPKGTIVGISPYVMHRNPKYFADPERFDPSRFEKSAQSERPKHAYIPFGGGPRTCIGIAFALMELQVLLPMIVRAWDLDPPSDYELELDPSVTLRPANGMPVERRAITPLRSTPAEPATAR